MGSKEINTVMGVNWIVLLTFAGFGISCVAGNYCNTSFVSDCYNSLAHYEGLGFPLFGEDDVELDETCKAINDSFDCVLDYVGHCNEQPECDEECKEMISDIGDFTLNTGLKELQGALCDHRSVLRETYLENYVCLEDNAEHYAACHNDSQRSQEFMTSFTDRREIIQAKCCFFSWYQDCFTNITREMCSPNATHFVSISLHILMGHIVQHMCKDNSVVCDRPPLPPEDTLDKDKPNKVDETNNDIDNFLDHDSSAHSTFLAFSLYHVFIAFCCVAMSKFLYLLN